jgi:hypothetical protein
MLCEKRREVHVGKKKGNLNFWIELEMLIPEYAVYGAMHFPDPSTPAQNTPAAHEKPVAHGTPSVWSFTRKEFVTEDEDWVLL